MTMEIRFRVWDKAGKRYLENFCVYQYGNVSSDGMFLPRDEVVVEQDTGLKDRNGKPICQGDIMKYGGEVRWEHDICGEYGCVGFKGVSDGHYSGEYDSRFDEVIGNVNENPELLSGLAEPKG